MFDRASSLTVKAMSSDSHPGRGRSWLLAGVPVGFVVAVMVPPVALAAGIGLGAAALVRRRRDGFYYFAIGVGASVVIYAFLAVMAFLVGGSSSGSAGD